MRKLAWTPPTWTPPAVLTHAFWEWFLSYSLVRGHSGRNLLDIFRHPPQDKSALRRSWGGWRLSLQQMLKTSHKSESPRFSPPAFPHTHKPATAPAVILEAEALIWAHWPLSRLSSPRPAWEDRPGGMIPLQLEIAWITLTMTGPL